MKYWTAILDIGQFSTKIGWGGENEPRHTFYTVCGIPKYTQIAGAIQSREIFIGNEVMDSLGLYKIIFPLMDGNISDWKLYEEIINYIFYLLQVDPTQINVLYSINPYLPKESRKKIFSIFLENFQVRALAMINGPILSLFSGGMISGLIVDMGAESIRFAPIFNGYLISHAIDYLDLGGKTIDKFMQKKMEQLGFSVQTSAQKHLIRVLKELACFVSIDYENDLKYPDKFIKEFILPDGTKFKIGTERFEVPEILFKPYLNELEVPSLPEKIVEVIMNCDVDLRPSLLNNIILVGGVSLFPNLAIRLKMELKKELIRRNKLFDSIRILAPNQRQFSNWIGGSIYSQLDEFEERLITRKKYFEEGIPEEILNNIW